MPAEVAPRFLQNIAHSYPDDDSTKNVYLQADRLQYVGYGDRHVLIWWSNGTHVDDSAPVEQCLQLTGQAGSYAYYHPVVQKRGDSSDSHQQFLLGTFSRAQRDKIISLADSVVFSKSSTVNSCRTWTRDLLEAMVEAQLMTTEQFRVVDEGVPLKERVPEV